ncbi:MAG TPA: class I SAM-dependent methyltransferase [Humisphaera sp.]|jgi:SAM-dependent methyltransferase|nr:class I SAM-dependent methyltransferase [Humisphaera sp.]
MSKRAEAAVEGRVGHYAERIAIEGTDRYQIRLHLERYRFAARYVDDQVVLDVACGEGYGSDILHRAGALRTVGLDISQAAVAHATDRYGKPQLVFMHGDAQKLPFSPRSFGAVVSFETVEHVPDYLSYLREVRRVLSPGGVYLVSTPNRLRESPGCGPNDPVPNPHHVREFTREELLPILGSMFKIEGLYGQGLLHPLWTPVRLIEGSRAVRRALHRIKLSRYPIGHIGTRGVRPWSGRYRDPAFFIVVCRAPD